MYHPGVSEQKREWESEYTSRYISGAHTLLPNELPKKFMHYIFILHCHPTNLHINWDLVFTGRFIRLFRIRRVFGDDAQCIHTHTHTAIRLKLIGAHKCHSMYNLHFSCVICELMITNTIYNKVYVLFSVVIVICWVELSRNLARHFEFTCISNRKRIIFST